MTESSQHCINPEFKRLLSSHNLDDLDAHSGPIYGIWTDFRLAYLNPAWFRFARRNGGETSVEPHWGLGRSILDAMPEQLRVFYRNAYQACLDSGRSWTQAYECSSDTQCRAFSQVAYPLGNAEGLLIAHSLIVEKAHDPVQRPACEPNETSYRDSHGLLHQCAHCRRVKNLQEEERWDWVPEWVRQIPARSSHTFCPPCFGHYFRVPGGG